MSHSMAQPPRRAAGNNNMRQLSNGRSSANNMNRSHGTGMQRNKDTELMNGVYKNQRFTHGLTKLIGCQVEVQVKNGKHYEGVFKTFSSDLEVVLEYAHLLDINNRGNTPTKDRIIEKLIVNFNDMVTLRAVDADTTHGETAMSDSFTDTGISRTQLNGSYKESEMRQLERWDDGENINTSLEENTGGTGWSAEAMFRQNAALGVKSSYDDSMDQYTTKLKDANTPEYKKRLAEAERYASEIESNQSSRRNVALENGDEVDEETRYSAVIRPNQQSHMPQTLPQSKLSSDNGNKSSKYVPPHHRGGGGPTGGPNNGQQAQFSQSARFPSGGMDRNRNMDNRNKTSPQTTPSKGTADLNSLKKFGEQFVLADNKEPSAEANKPPQHKGPPPVRPIHTPSKTPEKVISQSPHRPAATQPQVVPVSPTTKQTHVPAQKQPPAPVPEAKITKADAPAVASAPAAKPASSGASSAPSTVPQPTTTAPSAPGTESKPAASGTSGAESVAAKSKLDPNAKEFVFTPKAPAAMPAQPPPAMAPVHVQGHPPQHQHYGAHAAPKSKTATVSVVEAKQPRQDMPTPAQAMGQPLINSNHPHQQQYQTAPLIMVQPGMQNPRLQRNSSYTGSDGQPAPHQQPHFVQPQQQAVYMPQGMVGHVVHPQAGMQQPMANMHAQTPPLNAHLQQQTPAGAGGPTQGHHPPHQPPHSTAGAPAGMSHPNQQPNNQHMHHANYPQAGPSNHQGAPVSYMYAMATGHQGAQQPLQQQPPLQPSPHNPSPSPGTGPMVSQGYYQPPPPQQFFQQHAAAQAHMGGAVSQAAGGAPAYHPQPQLIYMTGHHPAAAAAAGLHQPYPAAYIAQAHYQHGMAQQYPPNFQQQQ